MQASWLTNFLKDFNYSNNVEYSIIKDKFKIDHIFNTNKGILQKVVINKKVIGYLFAIVIDVSDYINKIENNNNYVFASYFPINYNINENTIFKLLCKRYAYSKGHRILKDIFKNNDFTTLNEYKTNNIFNYFNTYFLNLNEKDYNNISLLNTFKQFDNRLKRYYKNKVILTYKNF